MADRAPSSRREWAELIASQFETDAVDAIEEGIARGVTIAASVDRSPEGEKPQALNAKHESAGPKDDAHE